MVFTHSRATIITSGMASDLIFELDFFPQDHDAMHKRQSMASAIVQCLSGPLFLLCVTFIYGQRHHSSTAGAQDFTDGARAPSGPTLAPPLPYMNISVSSAHNMIRIF